MEQRLVDIEIAIANLDKTVDELNQVIVEQAKVIDALKKQNRYLFDCLEDNNIKPLGDEAPPPHY